MKLAILEETCWDGFKAFAHESSKDISILIGHFLSMLSFDIQRLYKTSGALSRSEMLGFQNIARKLMNESQAFKNLIK
ncbi:MAG: hypothetical protein LBG80_10755 [Bacteroidales bacterium]|jgi:hypothetical protein|nr:hypothetical protein [Bacteroidales bacterium]